MKPFSAFRHSSPVHHLKERWRTFYATHERDIHAHWDLIKNLSAYATSASPAMTGGARVETIEAALADAKRNLENAQTKAFAEWVTELDQAGLLEVEWAPMTSEEENQLRTVLGSAPFDEDASQPIPNYPHRSTPSPPKSIFSVPSTSSSPDSWIFVDPSTTSFPRDSTANPYSHPISQWFSDPPSRPSPWFSDPPSRPSPQHPAQTGPTHLRPLVQAVRDHFSELRNEFLVGRNLELDFENWRVRFKYGKTLEFMNEAEQVFTAFCTQPHFPAAAATAANEDQLLAAIGDQLTDLWNKHEKQRTQTVSEEVATRRRARERDKVRVPDRNQLTSDLPRWFSTKLRNASVDEFKLSAGRGRRGSVVVVPTPPHQDTTAACEDETKTAAAARKRGRSGSTLAEMLKSGARTAPIIEDAQAQTSKGKKAAHPLSIVEDFDFVPVVSKEKTLKKPRAVTIEEVEDEDMPAHLDNVESKPTMAPVPTLAPTPPPPPPPQEVKPAENAASSKSSKKNSKARARAAKKEAAAAAAAATTTTIKAPEKEEAPAPALNVVDSTMLASGLSFDDVGDRYPVGVRSGRAKPASSSSSSSKTTTAPESFFTTDMPGSFDTWIPPDEGRPSAATFVQGSSNGGSPPSGKKTVRFAHSVGMDVENEPEERRPSPSPPLPAPSPLSASSPMIWVPPSRDETDNDEGEGEDADADDPALSMKMAIAAAAASGLFEDLTNENTGASGRDRKGKGKAKAGGVAVTEEDPDDLSANISRYLFRWGVESGGGW